MKVPDAEGVPLMVMIFDAQAAVTPEGKPIGAPIPVAPVVAMVMLVSRVLIHSVGLLEGLPAVLFAVTMMVPLAFTLPQPPVKGML